MIDFIEWLQFGNLGGIMPSASKAEVVSALGPPHGWASHAFPDHCEDYLDADLWGYGLWTLWFEPASATHQQDHRNGFVDAMTCTIEKLAEYGWGLDVTNAAPELLENKASAERFLTEQGLPCRNLNRTYQLQDLDSGEVIDRKRRLAAPALLTGHELRTRLVFGEDGGRLEVVGHPFSLRRQGLAYCRLDPDGRYRLIDAV